MSASDLQDAHICAQMLQRIAWAVEDAEREEESAGEREKSIRAPNTAP